MKKFFYIVLLALPIGACNRDTLSPLQFVQWVDSEKNGLLVKKEIGDYEFSLQYRPEEYIVLMEEKNEQISREKINMRKKRLEGLEYYTLRIGSKRNTDVLKTGVGSEQGYYDRLGYFIADMENDISLIEGNDTLACSLYHFERNYGMTPRCTFLLGFEKSKEKKNGSSDRTLLFADRALGTGPVYLKIKQSDITNIPELKTYQ